MANKKKEPTQRKGKPIMRTRGASNIFTSNSVDLSLEDALEYVYTYKKSEGMRDRTLSDYRLLYGYFTDWLGEYYPEVTHINEITSGLLRQYVVHLSEEQYNSRTNEYGLSPFTVNIRIRLLKAFFTALHKEEVIDKNPAAAIKQLKVDEDTFEPLTEDEIDRLLKVPDVREYAQFRDLVSMFLMLDTGIRCGEMFDLEMKDVDFKSRCIVLPGGKTKNRKPRILPLSNQVLKLLMELITEVKANFDTDYVFVSNFGEKYLTTSFRRRVFIYKEKANINKKVSPHGLRHQFCRDYILNGGDIFTLQRIAGHQDITTTRKYIQFTTDDIKKQHALYSPVARLRTKYRK